MVMDCISGATSVGGSHWRTLAALIWCRSPLSTDRCQLPTANSQLFYTPVMKKVLGIFALMAAAAGALMFWRRRRDDDEFLDEELE
jgi:hypothetical protein